MTIENFFTSKLQTASIKGGQQLSTGAQALPSAQKVNFFDFILARTLVENTGEKKTEGHDVFKTQNTLLQSSNPALDKETGLSISDLIAANPEIAKEVQEFSTGLQDEISQTLALNKKAFDDLLRPVESPEVLAAKQAETAQKKLPSLAESFQLDAEGGKQMMSRLKSLLAKLENITGEQMQLANLTPAQVGDLKSKIASLLSAQKNLQQNIGNQEADPVAIEQIALGLVQIAPALKKMQAALQTPSAQPFALPQQQATSNGAMAEIAARLNKMTPGAEPEVPVMPADLAAEGESFEATLKNIGELKNVRDGVIAANAKPQAGAPQGGTGVPSILDAWPFAHTGSLLGSLNWGKDMLESYTGAGLHSAAPITGAATMTSLVTHAQAAIYPHPGVKIVAKALSNMAASGDEKTITLQMDPPELGRVKVQMIFGKDKTVKATILAEKPETFAMLQRDAQVLERALEDAGIDSAGSSLSFEMAGDDHAFGHNGKHDGYESGNRANKGAEAEPEILETTMTWHVDPHTGYTRYDILV